MNPMDELNALRDSLATIPGVATCAIGLEDVIGSGDYPLVRLVPTRITMGKQYNRRTAELLVYFGASIAESAGLPAVYAAVFALEEQIITKVKALDGGRYIETITDEDRNTAFKLLAVRCELTVS
jgi:hypothetical protein